MPLPEKLLEELRVHPGASANLARRSTTSTRTEWLDGDGGPRELAEQDLRTFRTELGSAQQLLYANDAWAVLVIIQGLDASGKDGTIAHVMTGVNPQGCSVTSFKEPSAEELAHDFLWRSTRALPRRGEIGLFNRSYYEEVLIVRVHPDVLAAEHLPASKPHGTKLWAERFEDINAYERHLSRNGTKIVKVFLHVSKDAQKRRFLERLDDPAKHWKFSSADLAERAYFDDYQRAYEDAITATSTEWAPWYVVPADHKYAARALVGGLLVNAVASLRLEPPSVDPAEREKLAQDRAALLTEDR